MSDTIEMRLAPQLGLATNGRSNSLALQEGSWAEVAAELRRRYPALAERILTQTGCVAGGFALVVNDSVVRRPEPSLSLRAEDEIYLIAAIAGGGFEDGEGLMSIDAVATTPRIHEAPHRAGNRGQALIIDLNNYARYPTLAIGYLRRRARGGGFEVDVSTPLSHGVPAVEREHPESIWDQLQRRVYFSTHPLAIRWHDFLRARRARWIGRPHPRLVEELERIFAERKVDVLLMSAYMDHYPTVRAAGEIAARHDVPVVLGGPVFNLPNVAREWLGVPGLAAIVGGEVDLTLPEIVSDLLAAEDLTRREGVHLPDGRSGPPPLPLQALDRLPTPDFTDFPWNRYPRRVIPIVSGRGCDWDRCLFCADVHTANGRTFRSRSIEAVLQELEQQSRRYSSTDFIFLDIKLNSNLEIWTGSSSTSRSACRERAGSGGSTFRRAERTDWTGRGSRLRPRPASRALPSASSPAASV